MTTRIDEALSSLKISTGFTLVDITKTNVVSLSVSAQRNQQRNFETLTQVLSLRAQLMLLTDPVMVELDITNSDFGSNFTGVHKVWTFQFGIEQDAVYAEGDNPFGTLEKDFVNVPIITGLNETVTFTTPIFCTNGPQRNICFESGK